MKPTQTAPRPNLFARVFLDHPATVGESYFQHLFFALKASALLIWAGIAAMIHAFVPSLCQTTASRIIKAKHAELTARSHSNSG